MSNLINHARTELEMAGLFDKDSDYGGMLGESVLKIIEVFSKEDFSGASASLATSLIERLSRFEPLTPLTGEDSEWNEIRKGRFQNNRCSHVFKENGQAYDSQGIVFEEPDGCRFTSRDSRVNIEFPYTPTEKIKKVDKS